MRRNLANVSAPALIAAAMATSLAVAAPPPPPPGGCPTRAHLFLVEDTNRVLNEDFSNESAVAVQELMRISANALISTYGDNFDFVGCWTTFPYGSQYGAFYQGVKNDVQGIGPTFDVRQQGQTVVGQRLQGRIMMKDLASHSNPQNALAHEFAHRWVCYLPPMAGFRDLGASHFTCRIDLGGGCHGEDWTGTSRLRVAPNSEFNIDTGTRFSYLDLYLMGLVTAAEVDAGMVEQRYLDDNFNCASPYSGIVTNWSMSDIIATAGVRVPSSVTSQKAFRAGWIVFYPPGQPPTTTQLDSIVSALRTFGTGWSTNTLGRSTMDQTLFPDANCDGVQDFPDCNRNRLADSDDIASGRSTDTNLNGVPDECDSLAFTAPTTHNSDPGVSFARGVSAVACAPGMLRRNRCEADANGDGKIDSGDLLLAVQQWVSAPDATPQCLIAAVQEWVRGCP